MKKYLPSVTQFISFLVTLVILNAILDLSGLRDWVWSPISAWRNRNAG